MPDLNTKGAKFTCSTQVFFAFIRKKAAVGSWGSGKSCKGECLCFDEICPCSCDVEDGHLRNSGVGLKVAGVSQMSVSL